MLIGSGDLDAQRFISCSRSLRATSQTRRQDRHTPPEFQSKKPQFQCTLYQECGFSDLISEYITAQTPHPFPSPPEE
eukprot:1329957-Rhodomonas_salina.1